MFYLPKQDGQSYKTFNSGNIWLVVISEAVVVARYLRPKLCLSLNWAPLG